NIQEAVELSPASPSNSALRRRRTQALLSPASLSSPVCGVLASSPPSRSILARPVTERYILGRPGVQHLPVASWFRWLLGVVVPVVSVWHSAQEDEENGSNLLRRTTIGNGPPEAILDWTREIDSDLSQSANTQVFSRKHWRLLQCQNGLRIFEELSEVDYLPRSCSRAMRAVGVVDAACEDIFELIMSMDGTRFEWDCSFQYGSLVEEVDGHTAIIYHRLQLDWFSMFVWPRDLCYVRYWRRNDDGSYVVLFRSRVHENCGPQPGFVRAHLESGGFNISPLKSRNGRPRSQVQHLMQVDLKGWGVGYVSSFQQHCLLQVLNSVAGLREYFSQTDERIATPRIPVMVNMTSASMPSRKNQKFQDPSIHPCSPDRNIVPNRNSVMMDEDSDEDEDYQIPEAEQEGYRSPPENEVKITAVEEPTDQIDSTMFSGTLRRDDNENARNCWRISDGNNFKVRSKKFCRDKSKVPAGKPLMDLVAVDWFKNSSRMDHVARRPGCAAQVYTPRIAPYARNLMWFVSNGLSFLPTSIYYWL
ncbi:protein ENHANCED DISEASE RESISTANCE 2-like, partial [Spinacia oleracea]|uniref:Protein ENHANCED DISEASE RESISTANCE 2-like n=1 Tax=Spinacia oleracea TaxID=3562 RepID=A0ABM3QQU4_SPIOL